MSDAGEDPLDAAWARLEKEWETEARHHAFVRLAASLDRLPDAAKKYRECADVPERSALARAGLDDILRIAMAMLTPPVREDRASRGIWLLPLVTLGMLFVLTFAIAAVVHRRSFNATPVLGTEVLLVALLPWNRIVKRL